VRFGQLDCARRREALGMRPSVRQAVGSRYKSCCGSFLLKRMGAALARLMTRVAT